MTAPPSADPAAADRARLARRTSLFGVAFQGVYAVAQFVILAILIRAVGTDAFGYWITVFAASQWMMLAPLGVPKALVTRLSRGDATGSAFAVRWATVWVSGMCGAVLVVLLVAGPWLDWGALLQAPAGLDAGLAAAVAMAALGMALLAAPLGLGGAVLLARQRGDLMHATAMAGQVVAVAATAGLAWAGAPLWALALAIMAGPVVGGAAAWAVVGAGGRRGERAAGSGGLSGDPAAGLLTLGLRFLAVEVATVALMQSGPIVLAWAREPADVAVYAAAFRPVGLLMASYMSVAQAYWPAFGEADAAGDRRWLVRGLTGSLRLMAGLWVVGAAGILLAGRPFIALWLGPDVVPGYSTLLAALLFAAGQGLWVATAALMNGLGLVGRQILSAAVAAAVLAGVGYPLAVMAGPAGMFAGQALAAGAAAAVNGLLILRHKTAAKSNDPADK